MLSRLPSHDPDLGLLAHLPHGRDQHMLTGQRLALWEAPVVVTGRGGRRATSAPGSPGRQSSAPAARIFAGLSRSAINGPAARAGEQGAVAGHAGAGRTSPGDAGSRCHRRPATTTRWSRPWPAPMRLRRSALLGRVRHRDQRLDPAVQVAVHQVGGADPHLTVLVLAGAERVDPGVLQEPAEHAADADRLRQSQVSRAGCSRCRAPTGRSAPRPSRPRYRASTIASSTIALVLELRSGRACPARCRATCRSIRADAGPHAGLPARPAAAGTSSLRLYPVRWLNRSVTSLADRRIGGQQAEVLVRSGRSSDGSCRCRCGSSGAACHPAPRARPAPSWQCVFSPTKP